MLVSITYFTAFTPDFQNGGRPPSWIFIFSQYLKKSNLRLFLRQHAQFGEDRTIRGRVIAYFLFSIFKMAAVRHLGFGMTSYRTTHDLYLMVLTSS